MKRFLILLSLAASVACAQITLPWADVEVPDPVVARNTLGATGGVWPAAMLPAATQTTPGVTVRIPPFGAPIGARAMTSPPEVTSGTTSSAISGSVLYGPANAAFRYSGARPVVANENSALYEQHRQAATAGYPSSLGENLQTPWAVEFETEAEDFEFLEGGRLMGYKYYINGEAVSPLPFTPALAYGVGDNGSSAYHRRFRFGARTSLAEPTWPTVYGQRVQDGTLWWRAERLTSTATVFSTTSWSGSGATGSTPPTGWTANLTPDYTIATHDGVANALGIVADAASENTYRNSLTNAVAYVARVKAKVISGTWTVAVTGGTLATLTTSNCGRWTEWYVPFTASGTLFNISSSGAGSIWLERVEVFAQSATEAETAWAASTMIRRNDRRVPTTPNGFAYVAERVRPEPKLVRVEMSGYGALGGVRLPADAGLRPPSAPRRLRAVVLGDSYTLGAGAQVPGAPAYASVLGTGGWAIVACNELGWEWWIDGSGSSGYIATGNGGAFSERIARVLADEPDVVILAGGYNDHASPAATVAAAFTSLVGQIRAARPACAVIAVGPWLPQPTAAHPTLARAQINRALRESAASLGVPYIAPMEAAVITGDNTVPGSGNATIYFESADQTHPNHYGHDAIGRWVAGRIRAIVEGRGAARPFTLRAAAAWAGVTGGEGAPDTTPPTGWGFAGTVTFAQADHDGVAGALKVLAASGTGNNFYDSTSAAGLTGYANGQIRTTFKMKVVSGAVEVGTRTTDVVAGKLQHQIRVRSRPVGSSSWTEQELETVPAGRLQTARNTTNTGSWTEYEITGAWNRDSGLAFYSTAGGSANTYWLADVSVEALRE